MAEMKNGPRPTSESRPKNETTVKSTRSVPDFNRCDRSCGQCFVTFLGDVRKCEVEAIGALKRELARAIAGEGSR